MRGLFADKVVSITGACGGFGRATAHHFASEGARLVLSDLDRSALEAFASSLDAEIVIHAGSVADDATLSGIVELGLERFGRLDIAVNNAGIVHHFKPLPDISEDEAMRVIDIDLLGVFRAMKYQLPVMEKQFAASGQGGVIVNIASVAGLIGAPGLSIYAAAKHGVVGLTRSAALEYARRGVRINAVCPSFALTPMLTDALAVHGEAGGLDKDRLVRGIPMRRIAKVDEVVVAISFAASPANSFMTGQTIQVDGGLSAG